MILEPPNELQLDFIKKEECYQPPEKLEQDINQLIEWLSKQPHLPNITDRKWLLHFIIGCKYNLQRTKQVMESYFVIRAKLPEYFGSITKEMIDKTFEHGGVSFFPKRTPKCERIICYTTVKPPDGNEFDPIRLARITMALHDLLLNEDPMYRNIAVIDVKGMTLSRLLSYTPTIGKNCVQCCINAFPIRINAIHFINPPAFINRIMMFFKMILPNAVKDRMIVHDTLEDFHKYIPKDILPEEFGGTCGSIVKLEAHMAEYMMANQEQINTRPTADLSKRPKQSKDDELDMIGTFKALDID